MEMKPLEAYMLADDGDYGRTWHESPGSAWWYDGRGAKELERNFAPYSISNIKGEAPTGMVRELRKTSTGIVTVLASVHISDGFDGLFVRLYDSDKNDAACMYTKDGAYYALGRNQKEKLLFKEDRPLGKHIFKIVLNFETRRVRYYVDDVFGAELPLTARHIKFYKIGTFAGHIIDVTMGETRIHANYALHERFSLYLPGTVPAGWQTDCTEDATVKTDGENLVLTAENGAKATIAAPFAPCTGKYAFEAFFFMPKLVSGAGVALLSDGKPAFELTTADGFFCVDGKTVRYALDEMWYRLRFEFDTAKKQVLLRINGKNIDTFKLSGAPIDGMRLTLASENAVLKCDHIHLFPLIDYPDYCPKPKIPKGMNDYVIGMNMCSLWHTGSHIGWDCISAYPEIKPVIGYYDEGLPEVADWEIKFMLENGVDFQLYCWYASESNAPMKTTVLSEAIHDGYFNCKYSDMSRFALLWEAANAARPASSEAFRRYYVPYWIEQFFSDKRYMTIDNKAIMAVFGTYQLIQALGGPENVRREFDYLESELKKLGYEGLIVMGCGGPSQELKDCRFDAAYAYNWAKQGCDAEYTANAIRTQQSLDYVHVVPTASTGFNNVAWAETRSPSMTAEDFKKLHTVFRDEMLPSFKDKPAWTHRFVMMSNWNEYGEGTYIMPCEGLNGFGYLNAVRDVYTKEKPRKDDVPTKNQLSRLSYLYPQERRMLRTDGRLPARKPDKVLRTIPLGKGDLAEHWTALGCDAAYEKGAIKGVTHIADANIYSTEPLSISMKDVTHVRIRAKVSAPTTVEVFYVTAEHPDFVQHQSFGVGLKPGVEQAICAIRPIKETITGLRIDPAAAPDVEFEFYGVDLMKDTGRPLFELNGVEQPINSPVQLKDGYTLFPFNPYHVLVYKLGLYYEYTATEKKLAFYSKDASIVFTIGSRNVVINGEKSLLNAPLECFDGLPMLPLEVMSRVFGFTFKYKEPKLVITTGRK